MKIETIVVSPFQQNARILICTETKCGILVDPGDEAEKILARVKELEVKIEYIIATHGHVDHIGAVADIQRILQVPFYMHQEDVPFLQSLPRYGYTFGMKNVKIPTVSRYFQDGEIVQFGKISGKAIHVPGHSPGSLCYHFGEDLLAGDVLFNGSIGRTDLPGGCYESLENNIRTRLYVLPSNTRVYSGHGPITTIGKEKESNPFVHQ